MQALPTSKELTQRYGTSASVMRQVLRTLAGNGVLAPHGRGYRLAAAEPASSTGTIVLIAITRTVTTLIRQSPRSPELWRTFEYQARTLGTAIRLVAFHSAAGLERFPYFPFSDIVSYDRQRSVLGYLVLSQGFTDEWLGLLLSLLQQTGKPVSVMDEYGEASLKRAAATVGHHPRFRFFPLGTTPRAGQAVGRYLLSTGHRRVVCYRPPEDRNWVVNRLAGLREAYAQAGLPDAVCEVEAGPGGVDEGESAALEHLAGYRHVLQGFEELQAQLHAPRDRLFSGDIASLLNSEYVRHRLARAYARGRQIEDATAWVGIGDPFILPALPYLGSRRIRVPGQISLVGMDDSVEALTEGISSYNFNVPTVARTMLEHLMTWSPKRARQPAAPIEEIPGTVVERSSSGPPGTTSGRL